MRRTALRHACARQLWLPPLQDHLQDHYPLTGRSPFVGSFPQQPLTQAHAGGEGTDVTGSDARARALLRQAIFEIRTAVGADWISAKALWRGFSDEFDVDPSDETRALAADITPVPPFFR